MQQAAVVASKAVIVVILLISLLGQVFVIPELAAETVWSFPEVEYLRVPGILGCIAIVACAQIALVCIWQLLSMVDNSSVFQKSAFVFVNVIIGCGIAATALFVSAYVVLQLASALSPGTVIILVVGAVGSIGLTMLLVVMRGLLRKATQLEYDMAEVV